MISGFEIVSRKSRSIITIILTKIKISTSVTVISVVVPAEIIVFYVIIVVVIITVCIAELTRTLKGAPSIVRVVTLVRGHTAVLFMPVALVLPMVQLNCSTKFSIRISNGTYKIKIPPYPT